MHRALQALAGLALLACCAADRADELPDVSRDQWAQYEAPVPKTILELQPFRRSSRVQLSAPGGAALTVTLIDLNPAINAWHLLTVQRSEETRSYHIENAQPLTQRLTLTDAYRSGIRISTAGGAVDCELWPHAEMQTLEQAKKSSLPDVPLCGGRLYLRNSVPGTYTNIERITNILRDHVWGGEQIVGFVRKELFKDAFIEKGAPGAAQGAPGAAPSPGPGPAPASVDQALALGIAKPEHLGIALLAGPELTLGAWYPARDVPGIYVSAIKPAALAPSIFATDRNLVNSLDAIEAEALDYLVAIDLTGYDLHYELGTDHPRVGWSERALPAQRDPHLPGPDGIGSTAPLVVNGIVAPALVARTAVAFAGGFKREHGAFRYGDLALQNAGSHYGFIEQGVVFSKLRPGLATLYVTEDGGVFMKTWTRSDDTLLARLRLARQNGVPLIEYDPGTGRSMPGPRVNQWGPGNWSGSSDERLRTLRSGVCLLEAHGTHYLIYGYFSTATPSAMARVFQAYGCRYAMHLDMNALEHTYFAVYSHRNGQIVVEHLIEGMTEVDRKGGAQLAPRFLSFPDDRDFFYLTQKEPP